MVDVVLQGKFYAYTPAVISEFQKQDWIDYILVSTWEGERIYLPNKDKVEVIFNQDVAYPGIGNRNRQIKSSYQGLRQITSPTVIKARTDQIIYDLPLMKSFYDKFQTGRLLFTCGLYYIFPFHPRDHFIMGKTEDVLKLFDAPFDTYDGLADYTKCVRAETWIGSFYYSRFSEKARHMTANPLEYLVDGAPKIQEAIALDFQMRDNLFKVFPRINLAWPKHNLSSYHYHEGEKLSEYWFEENWAEV